MSTTIRCAAECASAVTAEVGVLSLYAPERVFIEIHDGLDALVINPTRSDFLAAIESELGVRIVEVARP